MPRVATAGTGDPVPAAGVPVAGQLNVHLRHYRPSPDWMVWSNNVELRHRDNNVHGPLLDDCHIAACRPGESRVGGTNTWLPSAGEQNSVISLCRKKGLAWQVNP